MEAFARWLKAARVREGLTQEELGQRAGCSKSYISTLERNAPHSLTGEPIQPDDKLVDAIADALNEPRKTARLLAGYAAPACINDLETEEEREVKRTLKRVPERYRPGLVRAFKVIAEAMTA